MKVYFERRILVGFIIALVILASLGVYAFLNSRASTVTNQWVTHTNDVLYHIEQLNSSAVTIEAAFYRFALVGDSSFAGLYKQEITNAGTHFSKLAEMLKDNPAQLQRLDSVRALGREKVKLINAIIRAPKQSRTPQQWSLNLAPNESLMQTVRGVVLRMQQEEKFLLQQRTAASREGERKFISTFILLQAVTVVIIILVFFTVNQSFHRRVKAEQDLQEASAQVKDLYDNAPCGYHSVDADNVFVDINNTWLQWLGYTREEVVNRMKFSELISPKSIDSFRAAFEQFKSTGSVQGLEFEVVRKNGETFYVILNAAAIYDRNGRYVKSRSTVFDISDRKRAEEKVQQLNHELEAFTYSVSHDLRAPLRSIDGYSRILKEDFGATLDTEANRLMDVIMKNAKRMGKLIDDLLDFSRIGRKELTHAHVDMQSMAENIKRELLENENGRIIHLTIGPLEAVEGDPSMLRQVWTNLLSNAIKYSSKSNPSEIDVSCRVEDGHTVYSIHDNGVGFDMKYADKLFGVFQRLHKIQEFDGTGVGLALVHRIITRHGGKVWASAKVNGGATFSFYIPTKTRESDKDKTNPSTT